MADQLNENPKYRTAREILVELRGAGHQAYFAGGCVRDMLLGVEPKDFDVATSATPDVVVGMFAKTYSVGAHFGVVLFVCRMVMAARLPPRLLRFVMMERTAMGAGPMRYGSRPIHGRMCCGVISASTECCLIQWSLKRRATLRVPCSIMWVGRRT
jgi:hypothetical protein